MNRNFSQPMMMQVPSAPPDFSASGSSSDVLFGNDFGKVIKNMVDDKLVQDKFEEEQLPFWALTSRSFKLTFFETKDGEVLEHLFEASVCAYLRSLPRSEYTPELHQTIQQARMIFFANTKRAIGTTDKKMNERVALLSQIRHNINEFMEGKSGQRRLGMIGKLVGR